MALPMGVLGEDGAPDGHAALPRWPDQPPALDEQAQSYTVLVLGGDGAPSNREGHALARSWLDWCAARAIPAEQVEAPPGVAWLHDPAPLLEAIASTKNVGWRLAICGEESLVLAIHGAVTQTMLLDAEVVAFPTSRRQIRLYCPSCGATSTTVPNPSGVGCSGCQRPLRPQAHLSRTTGRYLSTLERPADLGHP